jgi:hypothetical protein
MGIIDLPWKKQGGSSSTPKKQHDVDEAKREKKAEYRSNPRKAMNREQEVRLFFASQKALHFKKLTKIW